MEFSLKTVTPAQARKLLEDTAAAGFCNRPLSAATTSRYANMMRRGLWHHETADTVKIAIVNGKRIVIDGQHRLSAVIAAEVSVKLWFVEPVPVGMFRFFDQGKSRDLADMLAIAQFPDPKHLSSAGRMLFKEDNTGSPFVKPDAEESLGEGAIFDYVNELYGDDLKATFTTHERNLKDAQKLGRGSAGLLLYTMMRAKAKDEPRAVAMLDYLGDLTAPAPHNAFIFAVEHVKQKRLEFAQEGGGRVLMGRNKDLSDLTTMSYSTAWNLMRGGRRVGTLNTFRRAMAEGWVAFS